MNRRISRRTASSRTYRELFAVTSKSDLTENHLSTTVDKVGGTMSLNAMETFITGSRDEKEPGNQFVEECLESLLKVVQNSRRVTKAPNPNRLILSSSEFSFDDVFGWTIENF